MKHFLVLVLLTPALCFSAFLDGRDNRQTLESWLGSDFPPMRNSIAEIECDLCEEWMCEGGGNHSGVGFLYENKDGNPWMVTTAENVITRTDNHYKSCRIVRSIGKIDRYCDAAIVGVNRSFHSDRWQKHNWAAVELIDFEEELFWSAPKMWSYQEIENMIKNEGWTLHALSLDNPVENSLRTMVQECNLLEDEGGEPEVLHHDCDLAGGHMGSLLFLRKERNLEPIGIYTGEWYRGEKLSSNRALLFTPPMFNLKIPKEPEFPRFHRFAGKGFCSPNGPTDPIRHYYVPEHLKAQLKDSNP